MNALLTLSRKLANNVTGNNVSQVVQLLSLCALISGTMAAVVLAGSLAVVYSVLGLALFLTLPLVALACVLGVTGALVWALVTDGYRRNANARAWLAEFKAQCAREDAEWKMWQERTEALNAKLYARELTLAPMVVAMACDEAVQSVRLGMSEARREVVESVRATTIPAPVYERTPVNVGMSMTEVVAWNGAMEPDGMAHNPETPTFVYQAANSPVAAPAASEAKPIRKAKTPARKRQGATSQTETAWQGMDNEALAAWLRQNGHKSARKNWSREKLEALARTV